MASRGTKAKRDSLAGGSRQPGARQLGAGRVEARQLGGRQPAAGRAAAGSSNMTCLVTSGGAFDRMRLRIMVEQVNILWKWEDYKTGPLHYRCVEGLSK